MVPAGQRERKNRRDLNQKDYMEKGSAGRQNLFFAMLGIHGKLINKDSQRNLKSHYRNKQVPEREFPLR